METIGVEARIRILESQVARQRYMIAVTLCALLCIPVYASRERTWGASDDVPKVVKAKAFHVVSDTGSVLVELAPTVDRGKH